MCRVVDAGECHRVVVAAGVVMTVDVVIGYVADDAAGGVMTLLWLPL